VVTCWAVTVLLGSFSKGPERRSHEINLATAETLDCLCGILDTAEGSVTLVDRGYASSLIVLADLVHILI